MLVFLSILFVSLAEASCGFRPGVKSIYSLSAPVTMALRDLGLLKSGAVKGVSVFHPLSPEDFSGEILPGGIYLSTKVSHRFSESTVIFDESRELRKNLRGTLIEIKTRGLEPLEVTDEVIRRLKPLLQDCDEDLDRWRDLTVNLEKKLLSLLTVKRPLLFYLGEFTRGRPPELVISHDGVVKFLKRRDRIETYPSTLAYTPWAAQVIRALPSETISVFVKDSGRSLIRSLEKASPTGWNFKYPGALTPGKTQLEAWIYLFGALGSKK